MLRTIKLYGELGRRFGKLHRLAVESVAEAVRALCITLPGFEKALREYPHGFHVVVGNEDRAAEDRLVHPVGEAEAIKLIPVTAGSKGGFFQAILGAVLIAVGFFIPGPWSPYLIQVGAAMVLGGVAQMLAPAPKQQPGSDDQTKQSYIFSGAVNTSVQGGAVPIGYGRMIVGSQVLSMGLTVQELPT